MKYLKSTSFQDDSFEYSGFVNRTSSTLSFVDGTRIFTIAPNPNYDLYIGGNKILSPISTNFNITISNTIGTHFIYFTIVAGVVTINESMTAWNLKSAIATVATVYWDGTKGSVGDERHGLRSLSWHEWAHKTIKTRYESGLDLTVTNTTTSTSSGIIHDEDITFNITTQSTVKVWYRNTGGTTFKFDAASARMYKSSGGTEATPPMWDNAGTPTAVGNAFYAVYWVYASNDYVTPIYSFMGQQEYTTLTLARAATPTAPHISWPNIANNELKLLYKVIFRNTGGNTVFTEIHSDYRNDTSTLGSVGGTITTLPASSITYDDSVSLFNGGISSNIQAILPLVAPRANPTFTGNITSASGGYIYGDTTNPSLLLSNASGTKLSYGASNYLLLSSVYNQLTSNTWTSINVGVGSYLTLQVGTVDKATLASNGNFGVGVTTVNTKIEADGVIRSDRATVPSQYLEIDGGTAAGNFINGVGASKKLIIQSLDNLGTGGANTGIYFNTGTTATPINQMFLSPTGLAIGQSYIASASKLDVYGNASFGAYAGTAAPVNGMIISGAVGIGWNATGTRKVKIYSSDASIDVALDVQIASTVGSNYAVYGSALGAGATLNQGGFFHAEGATSNYGLRIWNVLATATNYSIYSDSPAQSYIGGKVGIGITAPNTNLEVVEGIRSSRSGMATQFVEITGNIGTFPTVYASSYDNNKKNLYIQNWYTSGSGSPAGTNDIIFGTGISGTHVNQMKLQGATGNFGVNIETPLAKLHVAGTAGASDYGLIVSGGDSGAGTNIAKFNMSNGTTALFVRGDGNVGVGVTSPFSKFTVSGYLTNLTSQMSIVNNEGGCISIRAGISGVTNQGATFYTSDVNGTNQNNIFCISATKYMGINTLYPSNTLSIHDVMSGGSTAQIKVTDGLAGSTSLGYVGNWGNGLYLQAGGYYKGGTGWLYDTVTSTVGAISIFGTSAGSSIILSTTPTQNSAPIDRLTISSAGNLLVGNTTTAGSTAPKVLSLGGTYSTSGGLYGKLKIWDDGINYTGIGQSSGQLDYIISASGSHVWYTNGSQRMKIDGNGVFSLGATSATLINGAALYFQRQNNVKSGISWYLDTYNAWCTYMSPAAQTNCGPSGNLTAPSGTYVTSWALRNFIEGSSGYGWTWENGTSTATTPAIVAELSSSTGNFKTAGSVEGSSIKTGNLNLNTQAADLNPASLTTIVPYTINATGILSIKLMIYVQYTPTSIYQLTEILALIDGSTVVWTEYGNVLSGANIANYTMDIDSGNLRLLAANQNTGLHRFKVVATQIS